MDGSVTHGAAADLSADRGGARLFLARVSLDAVAVGSVVIIATLVRFVDLAGRGYWRDEVFTVDLTRLPFTSMLRGVANTEGSPPLYYVLVWGWAKLFGTSEAGLRSFSALVGVLTVIAIYLAGRRLFSSRVALVAAAIVGTSPLLVWYSQEARSYNLGVLLVSVSLVPLAQIHRTREVATRPLLLWTAACALALTTHYFTVFAVAPEALWLLAVRRPRVRPLIRAILALAVVALGLLPLALDQRGNPGWIAGTSLIHRIVQVPSEFLAGPQPNAAISAVPLGLIVAVALFRLVRAGRAQLQPVLVPASIGASVLLLPLVLSLVGVDFFLARGT